MFIYLHLCTNTLYFHIRKYAVLANSHIQIYASKKTESQVDMKEAKRMTLFIIMINVSRNGIKAIMKNNPIKYLQKTRRKCGLQSPPPSLTKPMRQLKSACTTGPKPTIQQNTVAVFLTRTIQEKSNVKIHPLIASNNTSAHCI